jgi:hypothetical protein
MELRALIVYYTVWLVVAIASGGIIYHLLARRDLRHDRAAISARSVTMLRPLSQALLERSRPSTPAERDEFQNQKAVGVRVSLWLTIPAVAFLAYGAGREWWLANAFVGLVIVPAFGLPMSVTHTYLLRLFGYRGPAISTATGVLLGVVLSLIVRHPDYTKALAIYGGVYGLIIGLGNTSIFARRPVGDDRPRTLEEQARADGL